MFGKITPGLECLTDLVVSDARLQAKRVSC